MKKYSLLVCLLLTLVLKNYSNNDITAYLTYSTFNAPAKGPYLETYLSVMGSSVKFVKNVSNKYQGAVDVSIQFLLNGEIKNAQKYTLNSPEIADTGSAHPNFIDQQRFSLANGNYTMEISIADKNQPTNKPFTSSIPVSIHYTDDSIKISDVQLLESFTKSANQTILTKSGYDLVPYVSTFYPENINKFRFYAEVYNAKKIAGEGQKIVLSYFLETYEKKIKLNDYSSFSKQTANDVNILLTEFNIEALPSGNYNLVIEVRDKENKLQASQKNFIQRKNKQGKLSADDLKSVNINGTFVSNYKSIDTLAAYIKSLRPISSVSEVQFAENELKGRNLELMQQWFYSFWKARSETEPQLKWQEYYKEVVKVNKEFGTYSLKGYDTDRGRVYLQYGPPDQRSKVDVEPSAYPYEIWEYYRLVDKSLAVTFPDNKQSNKKFVFYNPDLVSNKYTLIHSTAQGEIYNTRWELLIHKRDSPQSNLDVDKAPDHYGSHSDEIYGSPR